MDFSFYFYFTCVMLPLPTSKFLGIPSRKSSQVLRLGEPSAIAFVGHRYSLYSFSLRSIDLLVSRWKHRGCRDLSQQWWQDRRPTRRSFHARSSRRLTRIARDSQTHVQLSGRTQVQSHRHDRRPRHDSVAQVRPLSRSTRFTVDLLFEGRRWAIMSM
jgi:hypothetical protein